jgi:hypothetical protein
MRKIENISPRNTGIPAVAQPFRPVFRAIPQTLAETSFSLTSPPFCGIRFGNRLAPLRMEYQFQLRRLGHGIRNGNLGLNGKRQLSGCQKRASQTEE